MARQSVNGSPLWQVSVTISREAEDAAAALLERLFGQAASVYAGESKDVSVATVYLSRRRDEILSKRQALQAGIEFLSTCGLETAPAKIEIRKVPREDWTTSWKKYFKTIEIGSALLIKPSWSKRSPKKGQVAVTLDPGLSFGTGQHPTTAFCLEQLVHARKTGQSQSFLDIGTGSGILAISAAKLGYSPIRASDNDGAAVRIARANARRNRVAHKLTIVHEDLTRSSFGRNQYDLICANLVEELLLAERGRILGFLRPGGKVVLSGLLTSQFGKVSKAYEGSGLQLETSKVEGEWKSGVFRSEAPPGVSSFGPDGP